MVVISRDKLYCIPYVYKDKAVFPVPAPKLCANIVDRLRDQWNALKSVCPFPFVHALLDTEHTFSPPSTSTEDYSIEFPSKRYWFISSGIPKSCA